MLVLSSGWLPGATGKHVLGLFSALPPPECPSIMPMGLLQVCLDQGSLAKSSCLPRVGGAWAWGGSREARRSFFKEIPVTPGLDEHTQACCKAWGKGWRLEGVGSGFMMKACSKMVPGRRRRVKCPPSPRSWLEAKVSVTGVLIHFILASPKKQLLVCILQGTTCYLESKPH